MNDVYAIQEHSKWCWAACIEMVFTYWGHPIDQEEIVQRTWGRIVDMPAQPYQIIAALNRSWIDRDGNRFRSSGDVFSATGATAAQDLARDMPLIVGSFGHAMVLTAIAYNRAPNSQGQVTGAMVRDPWPWNGRRELSAQEAAATMLLARVRVS
jgi:ABC-type bacteriocin/lantibiotic exporter with double-glycine peptidase domain